MMRSFFTSGLILIALRSCACSCDLFSFCETTEQRPEENIFKIIILEDLPKAIKVINLENIRGSDERDTLTIWDGTDYDCNGLISMDASQIGNPGDTLLIILPTIDSIENVWDVIGEYRMPYWFCNEYKLHIIDNILSGDINGLYPYSYLGYYNYNEFVEDWYAGDENCSLIPAYSGLNEDVKTDIIVGANPTHGKLTINTGYNFNRGELKLYDMTGRIIYAQLILNLM